MRGMDVVGQNVEHVNALKNHKIAGEEASHMRRLVRNATEMVLQELSMLEKVPGVLVKEWENI